MGFRLNFPMLGNGDYLTVLNAGQSNQQNTNSISENAMISYLGRVNYIYDDKNSIHDSYFPSGWYFSFS